MVDYRLGYFGMVVAVHWVQLLIRGELYPVHDLREREVAVGDEEKDNDNG